MADDDLLLDSKDLLDMFGADDSKDSGADFTKSLEDLFFSDDEEKEGATLALEGVSEAPELPTAKSVAPEEEPLVEDRKGMTEQEWRASPEYEEFKKQVIARHLRKKAEEDAQKRRLEEKAKEDAQKNEAEEEARRKADLVEKYKQAKAATIAQRAQAILSEADQAAEASAAAESDKESKFKDYLASLKGKMAQGALPKFAVPRPLESSAASVNLELDSEKCRQLAAMFEETREELLAQVGEKIGAKSARTMMKKTLAKIAKQHLEIFGRAAVNSKNELREDGALDLDRLARAFYSVPADKRLGTLRKALYELLEMRFIAVELGLGARTKGFVVGKTLDALEKSFAKKGYDAALLQWYRHDVVPATALSEGEEDTY
jgi:hypothetical protein